MHNDGLNYFSERSQLDDVQEGVTPTDEDTQNRHQAASISAVVVPLSGRLNANNESTTVARSSVGLVLSCTFAVLVHDVDGEGAYCEDDEAHGQGDTDVHRQVHPQPGIYAIYSVKTGALGFWVNTIDPNNTGCENGKAHG